MRTAQQTTQDEPVFTEIVDAIVIRESATARKFIFGESDRCWVPKKLSKEVNHVLYVERWLALQKVNAWKGVFIPGTEYREMRAQSHRENTITDVLPLLHEVIRGLNRIIRVLESEDTHDDKLNEATDKIMRVIRKPDSDLST